MEGFYFKKRIVVACLPNNIYIQIFLNWFLEITSKKKNLLEVINECLQSKRLG